MKFIKAYDYWFSAQNMIPTYLRLIHRPIYRSEGWYAPWWCAWFFSGLINFAYYWTEKSFTMRLDAPTFLQESEGRILPTPFLSFVLKLLTPPLTPRR